MPDLALIKLAKGVTIETDTANLPVLPICLPTMDIPLENKVAFRNKDFQGQQMARGFSRLVMLRDGERHETRTVLRTILGLSDILDAGL